MSVDRRGDCLLIAMADTRKFRFPAANRSRHERDCIIALTEFDERSAEDQRESALVRLSFPTLSYPVCERIIPVMANYLLSAKKITRSSERASVAAAAYRSAELIYCECEGRTHERWRTVENG